jgi:hypothetical protein
MLRLMLNSHPRIAVPFESLFLRPCPNLDQYGDLRDKGNAEKLLLALADEPLTKKGQIIQEPEAILAQPITTYSDLVSAVFQHYAHRRGKVRWGVKTPSYVTEIDQIWRLFPGCRIVHLVRDGRDVALSYRNISWGSSHTPRVAEDWRWKVMLGHKMGGMLGAHYLEVRYEDLVRQPETVLQNICAFLDEPYDAQMLNYHVDAEREMPSASMQWHRTSVAAPDESKVFAWKREMSLADQILFDEIAEDALEQFGYERVTRRARFRVACKRVYYYVIRRW